MGSVSIAVEGDGIGEVLTQGEAVALPFHAMAIETIQRCDPRRAHEAADDAQRRGVTVWRAVAAAWPRQDDRADGKGLRTGEAAEGEAAKRLLSRARRKRAAERA